MKLICMLDRPSKTQSMSKYLKVKLATPVVNSLMSIEAEDSDEPYQLGSFVPDLVSLSTVSKKSSTE